MGYAPHTPGGQKWRKVSIPATVVSKIETLAREKKVSVSYLIRQILEKWADRSVKRRA